MWVIKKKTKDLFKHFQNDSQIVRIVEIKCCKKEKKGMKSVQNWRQGDKKCCSICTVQTNQMCDQTSWKYQKTTIMPVISTFKNLVNISTFHCVNTHRHPTVFRIQPLKKKNTPVLWQKSRHPGLILILLFLQWTSRCCRVPLLPSATPAGLRRMPLSQREEVSFNSN